jgi:hypothetical protein
MSRTEVSTAVPWPLLGTWDQLVRFIAVDNEEGDRHPATLTLRSMMYYAFLRLRRSLEDPGCELLNWDSPFLPLVFEYPSDGDQEKPEITELRPNLDILTAGRAVVRKNGCFSPFYPYPLFKTLLKMPKDKFDVNWERWVDEKGWIEPVIYGDEEGRHPTILGVSHECEFSASLVFKVYPRVVDLDDQLVYDFLVAGMPWKGELPPAEWSQPTRDALWEVVIQLLEYLKVGEAPPATIRSVAPESSIFSHFEARVNSDPTSTFLERTTFQISNTVFGRFPEYARGLDGPVLPLTDGKGNLRIDSAFSTFATMLYPDDAEARKSYVAMNTLRLMGRLEDWIVDQLIREYAELEGQEEAIRTLVWTQIGEEYGLSFKSLSPLLAFPAVSTLHEDGGLNGFWGSVVGDVLIFIVGSLSDYPEHASVRKATYFVSKDLIGGRDRRGRPVPQGLPQVKAAWRRFRHVAHLWASYNHWLNDRDRDPEWSPAKETNFLAVAEYFRRCGESHYSHGQEVSHGPVLNPAKTWRPPKDLALPEVNLEWMPMCDWAKKQMAEYKPSK